MMILYCWLRLRDFIWGERGATAIEYGLIVAAIALGIIVALFLTGDSLSLIFSTMGDKMGDTSDRVAAPTP